MGRLSAIIRAKLALFITVIFGAVIGGATTGMVMAAIPDSNGQINACYKNSTQILRVTDPAANCATNETPLSWASTGGASAYGHFLADGTLDSNRSSNILSFSRILSSNMGQYVYCIDVASVPKSISALNEGYLDDTLASLDPSSQAWASISDGQCPANTDAVITAGLNGTESNSTYVTFY